MNVVEFVKPYYENKDIMHDLTHIMRVLKYVDYLIDVGRYEVDREIITYAAYFHGFIYSHEEDIRDYLQNESIDKRKVDQIVQISHESQKKEMPTSIEAKVLHDAHMIEGGKTFLFIKSIITGSVRGQTLEETIHYMEKNIVDQGTCYLEEAIKVYKDQQLFLKQTIEDLKMGLL